MIRDNTIYNTLVGLGIEVWYGSPTITGNTLTDIGEGNYSQGAIWCRDCDGPQIEANTFERNVGNPGGAIRLQNVTDAAVNNNLFVHNRAIGEGDLGGGAIYSQDSSATIANNTFVENCVGTLTEDGSFPAPGSNIWADVILAAYGGAVHVRKPGSTTRRVTLVNNIFYDNQALTGDSVACTLVRTGRRVVLRRL